MRVERKTPATKERVPRLGPGVDPSALRLTPAEGYLLSRVDGHTSWTVLRQIGGVPPEEVDRCLERWLDLGVVVLEGADTQQERPSESAAAPRSSAAAREVVALPVPDASLQLPLEVQKRVLDLAGRLDAPYHELLGVARDADRKTLKRAYFSLSKELHPDRYFRRDLGPFQSQLERVFKKIVEAYELLSDPMARAEIERSLAAATPPRAEAAASAAAPAAAPPARGPRRPVSFSVAGRVIKERKQRAKRLFEAGMAAFADGRWVEAAGSVRLAIAFDPWNAIYKEEFAGVQRRAQEERALQLVKEAESALELRDYPAALRAFEEALHYRPGDASLLQRAAKLALHTGGDLRQAKEWATEAVELEPRDAANHRLLGQIYKAAGLEANARRELEAALHLDPKDEEARADLRGLGGGKGALRWLGGRR
jgi:curved DNA-binding protein CbpA